MSAEPNYTETGVCPKCGNDIYRIEDIAGVEITDKFDQSKDDFVEVDRDYYGETETRYECDCGWSSE